MAAPPKVTIDDLSGKYIMNHTLSDPIDPLLALQGLSWFLRKAISLATVTLTVHQYTGPEPPSAASKDSSSSSSSPPAPAPDDDEEDQPVHIDILQVASGGISTTHENRVLDWSERDHDDRIFGKVKGRSRMFEGWDHFCMAGPGGKGGVDGKFLKAEVRRDGEEDDGGKQGWCDESDGRHVQSWVRNVDEGASGGWTAEQVWGFELIEGVRYYTRRVVVRKDGEGEGEGKVERARLVYDYKGEGDK